MALFVNYWLRWPSVENFLDVYGWGWTMCETFHFVGLTLLVGIIAIFDLRVLGVLKGLPLAPLKRLMPWAIFGFVLCVITGLVFVTGLGANLRGGGPPQYDVLTSDLWLQLKLLFLGLAGINILVYYLTGVAHAVDALGPEDDAPPRAKVIAVASLFLWLGVVWFGRLIPWGLPTGIG